MPYFYSNGHKLHYREKGTGDLLLILPGNTASSANHCDDIEYFSKYFHTVALDFWGTGKSDRLRDWTREWWSEARAHGIDLGLDAHARQVLRHGLGDLRVVDVAVVGG